MTRPKRTRKPYTPEERDRKNAAARQRYRDDPEFRERCLTNPGKRPPAECPSCGEVKKLWTRICSACRARKRMLTDGDRLRAYQQRYRNRNRERERVRLRAFYAKTKTRQMVRAAKWRAQCSGVPFDITEHDVAIPMFCPVLGIHIEQASGRQNPNSPSLDKIIPERGYVRGNVRVVSARANTLKRDGTLEEFKAIVRYLECAR
jgi:hypothetical protein